MANCNYVGLVKIAGEYSDGAWVITSENLPGLFLAGSDLDRLRNDVPSAIKMLYRLNYGMDVKVCAAGEPGMRAAKPMPNTWAAVPIQAAA